MLLVLHLHFQQDGTVHRTPELFILLGNIDPVDCLLQAIVSANPPAQVPQPLGFHIVNL